MLIDDIEYYLSIRHSLGFKLVAAGQRLRHYAAFAASRNEAHVRVTTAVDWCGLAPSAHARHIRSRDLRRFARFARAEDARHERIAGDPFPHRWHRPLPYIYSVEEIARIVLAAQSIRETFPMKRAIVGTVIGLVAATGLRISEALRLKFEDVHPDGHLVIRMTKFRKSRLVPLHATVRDALAKFVAHRRIRQGNSAYLFPAARGQTHFPYSTMLPAFHEAQRVAGIATRDGRLPRIHDLRHTFATRSLEKCAQGRAAISRHHLALTTYQGHAKPENTYWYLTATPELMADTASAAEALLWTVKP